MRDLVADVIAALKNANLTLATAESCTGGLLAAALTERSGSSHIFERGTVTYSNDAKMDLLAVPRETLDRFGAVSAETAAAMATGALANSRAQIAISITGIAGPDGGSADKPVGLVYIGVSGKSQTHTHEYRFTGDRIAIRHQARDAALTLLLDFMS